MICLKVMGESCEVPRLTSVLGFSVGLHWVMFIIVRGNYLGNFWLFGVIMSSYAMLCYAVGELVFHSRWCVRKHALWLAQYCPRYCAMVTVLGLCKAGTI